MKVHAVIPHLQKANWKRPFKNAGRLLVGRGMQGLMSLVYMALSAKALGVVGFGVLTLVYSSVMVLRNLLGFRSWQMIMSYGAQALSRMDAPHMKRLVNFSMVIEVSAGVIGAVVICLFAEPVLNLFSIPLEYTDMVQLFSTYLFLWIVSDVGLGILRLYDRHDIISWQLTIEPSIRLVGSAWFYHMTGDVIDFLWVWLVAGLISKAALIMFGACLLSKELAKLEQTDAPKAKRLKLKDIYREPEKGLWRYAWGLYAQSALATNFAPMFIAAQLGPAGAGIWRVAQRFISVVSNPVSKLLVPVIYTDMSWFNAAGNSKGRTKMIVRTGLVAGGITLLMVLTLYVCGEWLIVKIVGADFIEAFPVMMVLALGPIIGAFTFGIAPMMMTAGRVWTVTAIRVFAMAIFFGSIIPFVHMWGVLGAAISSVLMAVISRGLMIYSARDLIEDGRKSKKSKSVTEA